MCVHCGLKVEKLLWGELKHEVRRSPPENRFSVRAKLQLVSYSHGATLYQNSALIINLKVVAAPAINIKKLFAVFRISERPFRRFVVYIQARTPLQGTALVE